MQQTNGIGTTASRRNAGAARLPASVATSGSGSLRLAPEIKLKCRHVSHLSLEAEVK